MQMDTTILNAKKADLEKCCLFRVQIPTGDVAQVLKSITNITPLRYGNYDQVVFRHSTGSQQFRPRAGSKTGESELVCIACDEISFTVPKDNQVITDVIDAIFESHPHEEPVIIIQEVMCTRFKYRLKKDVDACTQNGDQQVV